MCTPYSYPYFYLHRHAVVVSGCGPLGLGMVAGAKQKNPALLIALDMFDWKVRTAVLSCLAVRFILCERVI